MPVRGICTRRIATAFGQDPPGRHLWIQVSESVELSTNMELRIRIDCACAWNLHLASRDGSCGSQVSESVELSANLELRARIDCACAWNLHM